MPSLQVPLALLRILMDTPQCHYTSFFSLLWPEHNPESPICFLMREERYIYRGREACSDMKNSFFLRTGCSPREWAMSMYVNFLTCKTSLYGFTGTLLFFLFGLRLSFVFCAQRVQKLIKICVQVQMDTSVSAYFGFLRS